MNPISRRKMLRRTSLLGATAGAVLPLVGAGLEARPAELPRSDKRKLKVVVTGGHPGDPEYGCGGTIARYTERGHEVVLLYLNKGEWTDKPGYDPAPVRVAEAKKACDILKARPAFAGQIDGKAIVDQAHYESFHRLLQAERPDVVLTHWPIDNHADHRALALLVYESWLRMGRNFSLYYYEVSNGEDTVQFTPTHYVDITGAEPKKRAACYAHASQSPDRYYPLQEMVTKMRGVESGHRHAEGYIRHVQSPDFALPMGSL